MGYIVVTVARLQYQDLPVDEQPQRRAAQNDSLSQQEIPQTSRSGGSYSYASAADHRLSSCPLHVDAYALPHLPIPRPSVWSKHDPNENKRVSQQFPF